MLTLRLPWFTVSRKFIGYVAGVIGFLVPALFAWDIYAGVVREDPNTATWLMIWLMDITGLIIVIVEKNDEPWLQAGWLAAATLIMLAIWQRGGNWDWRLVETASFVACVAAVVLWQILKKMKALQEYKKYSVLAGVGLQSLAVYIAFVPQGVNYWQTPAPETWYLWFWSIVAGLLAIWAAKNRRDPAQVFIPWACTILNAIILVIVLL